MYNLHLHRSGLLLYNNHISSNKHVGTYSVFKFLLKGAMSIQRGGGVRALTYYAFIFAQSLCEKNYNITQYGHLFEEIWR